MELTQTTQHIKPYLQPQLGNIDGLTSHDIAKALSVQPKRIIEKIERPTFKEMCATNGWELVAAASYSGKRGRPGKVYTLGTRAAKAIVATFDSVAGYKYLDFLFECEKVATQALPKILEELNNLKLENEMLKNKPKRLKGPRTDCIPTPVTFVENLFGEIVAIETKWIPKSQLTPQELNRATKRHCLAVGQGAIQKAKLLDEKVDIADKNKHKKAIEILS